MQWSGIDAGLARAAGLAVAAEVDRQRSIPGVRQRESRRTPSLLVEVRSISDYNAAVTAALHVGMDQPSVFGWKGHLFRSRRNPYQKGSRRGQSLKQTAVHLSPPLGRRRGGRGSRWKQLVYCGERHGSH